MVDIVMNFETYYFFVVVLLPMKECQVATELKNPLILPEIARQLSPEW